MSETTKLSEASQHLEAVLTTRALREILRTCNSSLNVERHDLFAAIDRLPPDSRPNTELLIPVITAILDACYRQREVSHASLSALTQHFQKPVASAAVDLSALARKGRARRSIGRLQRRYTASEIARGAVCVLSAYVTAVASDRQTDFASVLDELIAHQSICMTDDSDQSPDYVEVFDQWLHGHDAGMSPPRARCI